MRIAPRRIRSKLESGDKAYGIAVQLPSPEIVEAVGYAGYDFAWIDAEHGAFDLGDVRELDPGRGRGRHRLARAGRRPRANRDPARPRPGGYRDHRAGRPRRGAGARDRLSGALRTSWHPRRVPLRTSRRTSQPGLAEPTIAAWTPTSSYSASSNTPPALTRSSRSRAREGLTGSCSAPSISRCRLGLGGDVTHPDIQEMHSRVIEATRAAGIEYVTPNAAWESDLEATGSRIIPVAGDRAALVGTFIRLLAESSGSAPAPRSVK